MIDNGLPQNSTVINSKKNLIIFILIILLTALLSGGGVYFWQQNEIGKLKSEQKSDLSNQTIPTLTDNRNSGLVIEEASIIGPSIVPTISKISSTEGINSVWNLFSSKLGFSIKIPKTASEYGGACANGELKDAMVPTTVFEDASSAYITVEYFNEYPKNGVCEKVINSFKEVDTRANAWKNGANTSLMVPKNWHVITAKVNDDAELDSFIKANYGSGCKLGTKTLADNGVYNVKIDGDGLGMEYTKCPINYMYALKYSPDFRKAATWGIGQDVVFASSGYKAIYDKEMIESFVFIF